MSECDERNDVSRLKLKKLCDQYRGKFPRIDGMRDLKDKSIAVLHFSAGKKLFCIISKNIQVYVSNPNFLGFSFKIDFIL